MDTAENTRASTLRDTHNLHADVLTRAATLARDRAETDRQQRDRVTQQTTDYISNLGRGGSQ